MARKIIAFLIGFLIVNAIVLFGHTILPTEIIRNIVANFCGACCLGYICKKRGFLHGAGLSIGNLLFVIIILVLLAYQTSDGRVLLPETPGLTIRGLSSVISGFIGGGLGEILSKREQTIQT